MRFRFVLCFSSTFCFVKRQTKKSGSWNCTSQSRGNGHFFIFRLRGRQGVILICAQKTNHHQVEFRELPHVLIGPISNYIAAVLKRNKTSATICPTSGRDAVSTLLSHFWFSYLIFTAERESCECCHLNMWAVPQAATECISSDFENVLQIRVMQVMHTSSKTVRKKSVDDRHELGR